MANVRMPASKAAPRVARTRRLTLAPPLFSFLFWRSQEKGKQENKYHSAQLQCRVRSYNAHLPQPHFLQQRHWDKTRRLEWWARGGEDDQNCVVPSMGGEGLPKFVMKVQGGKYNHALLTPGGGVSGAADIDGGSIAVLILIRNINFFTFLKYGSTPVPSLPKRVQTSSKSKKKTTAILAAKTKKKSLPRMNVKQNFFCGWAPGCSQEAVVFDVMLRGVGAATESRL